MLHRHPTAFRVKFSELLFAAPQNKMKKLTSGLKFSDSACAGVLDG
jgi:hypothetical protein